MAEWSIAPVLKTGVPRGTGGSNPSFSAEKKESNRFLFFYALNRSEKRDENPRVRAEAKRRPAKLIPDQVQKLGTKHKFELILQFNNL